MKAVASATVVVLLASAFLPLEAATPIRFAGQDSELVISEVGERTVRVELPAAGQQSRPESSILVGFPCDEKLRARELESKRELRYRLLPYNYTLAREACDTGLPMMRALWLHYPDVAEAVNLGSQLNCPTARPGSVSPLAGDRCAGTERTPGLAHRFVRRSCRGQISPPTETAPGTRQRGFVRSKPRHRQSQ